jgi:hypothetical protein
MSPLALMIRPRGSSPHHSVALVLALTGIRASKPLPLVHITSSAPSMLIALGGENSRSNSLVRSGRDRPTVILAAPRHQHEEALSAAVRWPASSLRARWRNSSAWLSIERTGTNRWPGRLIASQIAAASTWSLLLRRT